MVASGQERIEVVVGRDRQLAQRFRGEQPTLGHPHRVFRQTPGRSSIAHQDLVHMAEYGTLDGQLDPKEPVFRDPDFFPEHAGTVGGRTADERGMRRKERPHGADQRVGDVALGRRGAGRRKALAEVRGAVLVVRVDDVGVRRKRFEAPLRAWSASARHRRRGTAGTPRSTPATRGFGPTTDRRSVGRGRSPEIDAPPLRCRPLIRRRRR